METEVVSPFWVVIGQLLQPEPADGTHKTKASTTDDEDVPSRTLESTFVKDSDRAQQSDALPLLPQAPQVAPAPFLQIHPLTIETAPTIVEPGRRNVTPVPLAPSVATTSSEPLVDLNSSAAKLPLSPTTTDDRVPRPDFAAIAIQIEVTRNVDGPVALTPSATPRAAGSHSPPASAPVAQIDDTVGAPTPLFVKDDVGVTPRPPDRNPPNTSSIERSNALPTRPSEEHSQEGQSNNEQRGQGSNQSEVLPAPIAAKDTKPAAASEATPTLVHENTSAVPEAPIERIEHLRFESERKLAEAPLRSVRLTLGQGDETVALELSSKSQRLEITARTADQKLGELMQRELPQLSRTLAQNGFEMRNTNQPPIVTRELTSFTTNQPSDSAGTSGGYAQEQRQRNKRNGAGSQTPNNRKRGRL